VVGSWLFNSSTRIHVVSSRDTAPSHHCGQYIIAIEPQLMIHIMLGIGGRQDILCLVRFTFLICFIRELCSYIFACSINASMQDVSFVCFIYSDYFVTMVVHVLYTFFYLIILFCSHCLHLFHSFNIFGCSNPFSLFGIPVCFRSCRLFLQRLFGLLVFT